MTGLRPVMSDHNRSAKDMTSRLHRYVACAGLALLLGIPFAWLGIGIGMLRSFGGTSGDISQATAQITSGVALALWSTIIGQSVALVGLVLLLVSLLMFKIRDPWVLKWGRLFMMPWLILFPIGTVAGISMLMYFSRHREEFLTKNRPLIQPTTANDLHPT
jgi:hypothetical protein